MPLMAWDGTRFGIDWRVAVAHSAEEHGLDTITAKDHLRFRRAWLDGPTALAAVIGSASGR